ncbi:hypothetical protein ACFVHB_34525 [Kitasatospora sp. NPDC127111]|uniref:hypothetical protein n=1 Tax=Kitasatospora sp. NPDC127111 TaxID=3345363 RepID=UPI0036450FD0
MDTDVKALTEAVREVEKLIRETVVTPSRGHRRVPLADEPPLLAAAAALLDVVREFTTGHPDRMTTPEARFAFGQANVELARLAERLRAAGGGPATGGV